MKIAVCMKHVPDTATKIRIGPDGQSIDPEDVQYIMSPYDEYAVEESIRIREHLGEGSVTLICLGPAAAQQNIRKALAMGADDGILIAHDGETLDPYQVARNLASVLRDRGDDIIWMGRQSVDDANSQVGPITARLLDLPCISEVVEMVVEAGLATVHREIEGAQEVIEVALPAVFTAQKGLNEPRYTSLKGIMAAKKKSIEERPLESVEARVTSVSLELPPARPEGRIVGEGPDAAAELVRLLRDEAKAI